MKSILALFRIKQWTKNCLVFVPLIVSGEIINIPYLKIVQVAHATIAFILASVFIYIINDIKDFEFDKNNPSKQNRPIARGEISIQSAKVFALALFALNLISMYFFNEIQPNLIIALYILINICYSFGFKEIPNWEMLIVSSGFMLRIAIGTIFVVRKPSIQFMIIIMFGSLFIVTAKRISEKVSSSLVKRKVLEYYTLEYLKAVLAICASLILVSYSTFVLSSYFETNMNISKYLLFSSVIPFTVAILQLLQLGLNGGLESPENIIIRDRRIQISLLLWSIIFVTYVFSRS